MLVHSAEPFVLMTARSLLEDAGIPYRVADRGLQEAIGYGTTGLGSPVAEAVTIMVRREDAERASALMPPWIAGEPPLDP